MQSLCACLPHKLCIVYSCDCLSVDVHRKHVCNRHLCVCALALRGGAEHQCAVLVGLAVQHVEHAHTCFHGERAITPKLPLLVHLKHTTKGEKTQPQISAIS